MGRSDKNAKCLVREKEADITRTVQGALFNIYKAHPEALVLHFVPSMTKRLVGQLKNNFNFSCKTHQHPRKYPK